MQTKINKEKVSKTTYPENPLTRDEWYKKFGVASGYVPRTKYYTGNEFNSNVYLNRTNRVTSRNLFGKITEVFFNILNKKTWVG